ncbi:hypothetical protein ABVT39_026133 [Epinephelus coioides]
MAEPRIPVKMNRLCCRICSEVLRNPATVPCGHNFCMQCIQGHWDRDERRDRHYSCPECGRKFPSRPQLIRNTTLADLVRDTERCDDGSTEERRRSGPSKRPRSCTETSAGSGVCVKHSSPLDIYCCTDEQIICAMCAAAEHSGHTIGSVREERRRRQDEAGETQDYCESILVSVIDCLQRHYMSVREVIRGHREEATAQVEMSLQTLQEKMEEIRKRDAELDRLAQIDNDVQFLQDWPSLRRLCKEDHLHPLNGVPEDPLLPFDCTKRAVEELGRRLEEFCDKEFASIIETADSGEEQESGEETEDDDMEQGYEAGVSGVNNTVTEKDMEPKTRAQFLKSTSNPVSRRASQLDIQLTRPSKQQCSEFQFGACCVHRRRPVDLGSTAGERLPPASHVAQASVSSGAGKAKRIPLKDCFVSLAMLRPYPKGACAACSNQKKKTVFSSHCNSSGCSVRHRKPPAWSQDYYVGI